MAPWKTWLAHALFAAILTLAFSLLVAPWIAALLAWWGYMWRELSQLQKKFSRVWGWQRGYSWLAFLRAFVKEVNWLDSTLDVVAPAVSAFLVGAWLS